MNNDNIEDEIAPDFGTIAVDGAYLRFAEGFIGMQFYRDSIFPIHKDGKPTFDSRTRTILHETRIPYEQARVMLNELTLGFGQHDKRGFNESNTQWVPRAMVKTSPVQELQIQLLYTLTECNNEGQLKVQEYIASLLPQITPKLQEIKKTYPRKANPNEQTSK